MKKGKGTKKPKGGSCKTNMYVKQVSKGVHLLTSGNYIVRKQTNGVKMSKVFTNKAKAIKFYNSL